MSIVRLFSSAFAITVIVFIGITSFILYRQIDSSFWRLEYTQTEQNALRTIRYFDEQLQQVDSKAADWCFWDELYEFTNGKKSKFFDANITSDALTALKITMIAIVNSEGNLVATHRIENGTLKHDPKIGQLAVNRMGIFGADELKGAKKGFLLLGNIPTLIAARAIVKSDNTGPVAGTLYFGLTLDQALVAKAGSSLALSLELQDPSRFDLTVRSASTSLIDRHTFSILDANNPKVLRYFVGVSDSQKGTLIAPIVVKSNRDILALGHKTSVNLLVTITLLLVIGWISFTYVIWKSIVLNLLKLPHPQNLWVKSGSGSSPRLCNNASLMAL